MNHRTFVLALALTVGLALAPGMSTTILAEEEVGLVEDATGTDPRDFGSKFMPYYRYMELENDLEVNMFTLFGMYAFAPRFALTYEWPVAMKMDYSEVGGFEQLQQGISQGGDLPHAGTNPGGGGGLPFSALEADGDSTGLGDLNLRFFVAPQSLAGKFMGGEKSMSLMPIIETTLPTATEDLLGGESWIVSPAFAFVTDMPFKDPPLGIGFLALMNFYDFDAVKDSSRNYTSRFRGRWFWMQPLSKPASMEDPEDDSYHILDLSGLYILTEMQPVYDFREDEFSLWIGPEFGKVLKDGQILYFKPGWGIDNDEPGDRDFTFEVGFRYFM
jgi:hypothetical protein